MKSLSLHFISIGGSVMHNLAIALQQQGHKVTGSDDEIYEPSRTRLQKQGLLPAEMGWNPANIHTGLDAVILGMHARKDNPELLKAQELGLAVYSYPEFIYEQSKHKQRVVIAGSHGKTTITSILLHVLNYHKRNFDYLVGAQIEGFDTMVKLTADAPLLIAEGDEYGASPLDTRPKFLFFQPHIALISGIAWDHVNIYPTYDSYVHQFELLADSLPKAGAIVFDDTDDMLDVIALKEREDVTRQPYDVHSYRISNGQTWLKTKSAGDVPVQIFGEHNMKNIAGALAVCDRLGITEEMFYEAIQSFKGAARRLELVTSNDQKTIYRDFAHAPSKVGATTAAVRQQFPNRKLIACVELHTFSSLNKNFLGQYRDKLDQADVAVVFYSPHTLEMKRMEPISPQEIITAFDRPDLQIFTDTASLQTFLESQSTAAPSVYLLMSSGTFGGLDVNRLGEQ
ncbi:UDP-N-acetylmuramate--L-alanine ligase [Tellurirhabdus bombi]|uniref:UDP-N-acetylmuramate--L-alanine ligase n=1 Tax=Tellurirhabdus bombi TaxID=2907205 RepID=UPI001EFF4E47|nr:Mur ligase domain-containing protein [Tellurirhabdus bombi]